MALELLKRTRKYKGYYQSDMACIVGISKRAYNSKENGRTEFTISEIRKIIECLDLKTEEVNEIFFKNAIAAN